MLCSPLSDKVLAKIKYPAMAQLKMDGLRCNVVVKDNTVTFYSRNGKTFDLLGNLEQEFIDAARGLDVVFDGELLVTKDSKVVDRQTGNGILNKANKGTISEEEAKLVTMTVWDIISYDNWIAGKDSMIYVHRYNRLISLNLRGKINIVPSIEVRSLDEAKIVYENYYSKGYEGIILKNTDNIWEPKRSQTQIKFKGEETASLHVVGIQHGNGKYEGQIGSLICESEDGELMVNVGSGLTDEDRIRTDFIGKIIDVKYNAKIKSKGSDTWSLFLPRYLEIRFDRDTADTINHIK
jgi:ATP-dependent DNA ligase